MEQSLDKKPDLKDAIQSFFYNNKKKIFLFIFIVITITIAFFLWKDNNYKKNILISEKYTKAQLLLSKNDKEAATKYYEEIIFSNNKFYSILSLNIIIEKNLIKDKQKIKGYFEIIEKLDLTKTDKDLIKLKKALYFIKILDVENGNKILKELIEKDSNLKKIAEDIIKK